MYRHLRWSQIVQSADNFLNMAVESVGCGSIWTYLPLKEIGMYFCTYNMWSLLEARKSKVIHPCAIQDGKRGVVSYLFFSLLSTLG